MGEERIIDLETKLAHQEFLLEELNQVLYKQQTTIDEMEKIIRSLIKEQPKDIGPGDQKPPHY